MKSKLNWISVKDKPLYINPVQWNLEDEKVSGEDWECTEEGEGEFLAAVPLSNGKWWIKHCVVEDSIGLCVVGEGDSQFNEPAGYELEDITHYLPITEPQI